MDARITFSSDFKEKTKGKKLSPREKGKLHYEKLKEADKQGKLQFCSNRKEVALLAGYSDDGTAGQMWIRNLINRGHLIEELDEAKGIYSTYHYYLGSQPKYSNYKNKRTAKVAHTTPVILPKAYDSEPKVLAKAKATIKYTDGREIILEGYAGEDIATIIKALR